MQANQGSGSLYYYNSTYPKLTSFDLTNYTNTNFTIGYNSTSTCKSGNVTEQIMLFYIFDAGIFSITTPPSDLYYQNTGSVLSTNSFLFNLANYDLLDLNGNYYYQINIYWLTIRSNSTDTVYLNMDTVYFLRNKA